MIGVKLIFDSSFDSFYVFLNSGLKSPRLDFELFVLISIKIIRIH